MQLVHCVLCLEGYSILSIPGNHPSLLEEFLQPCTHACVSPPTKPRNKFAKVSLFPKTIVLPPFLRFPFSRAPRHSSFSHENRARVKKGRRKRGEG